MDYFYGPELYHHGIKGQKWGVRRFQNSDGSLTAAGRKRYGFFGTPRLERAANAIQRDADDLRKHGYKEEADAVQKQADKYREKAKAQAIKREARKAKIKNWMSDPVNQEKMKKAAKIGLAVAGTALAAYGAYKISEHNAGKLDQMFQQTREQGYQYLDHIMNVSREGFNKRTGSNDALSSYMTYDNKYANKERDTINKMNRNLYNRINKRNYGRQVLEGSSQGLFRNDNGTASLSRNYHHVRPGDIMGRNLAYDTAYNSYNNFLKEAKKRNRR